MTDTAVASPRPRKRRGWRIVGWIVLILIVLVVAAYFVGTSSAFIKAVVLPRVSNSLHADVTVSDASVHPFSSVVLRNLKVQPRGREPLLTVPEVRARYSLFAIMRGTIRVEDITVTSPTIHVIETPGGSNLDPLKSKEQAESAPKKPSKPTQIDLRKLTVSNATLRYEKLYANGSQEIMELTNVNVSLSNLKNGDSGKLTIAAGVLYQTNSPPPGDRGIVQGALNGEFLFALSPDLKPLSVKGQTHLAVTRAEGAMADFAAVAVNLDADIAPTEVRQVTLRFEKSGASLGEVHANGPLDMEKLDGQFKVELVGVDKRLLNLFGARSGMDFGTTTIQSTNLVRMANGGRSVTIVGQFTAAKVQVTRANQTTPTLDLRADYDASMDRTAGTQLIRVFTLNGTQNQRPLVNAELTRPMTIGGNSSNAVSDSTFNVVVTNLNLADWKPFMGGNAPEGIANAKLELLSQAGGTRLAFDLASHIAGLSAQLGANRLQQADVVLQTRGQATDLKPATLKLDLSDYQLQISQQGQPALTVSGSATYDGSNALANAQAAVHAEVTRLAAMLLPASNRQLPATPVDAKLHIALQNKAIDLQQFDVTLAPTQRAKNQLKAKGRVNFSNPDAIEGNLKLTADSLDLTDYYDVISGRNKAGTTPASPPTTPTAPAPGQKGPQPVATSQLPFRNFVMDAAIGQLYLREVEVTNFQTTATVNGGKASLKPLTFVLNGAPVNATADVDLSVPGSQYALAFDADHIPFAPLVNTFQPERKGELGGTLSAHAHISGVGTSGESLQKTLAGNFNIGTTNLNLDPAKIRSPMLRVLVAVVTSVPQLAQNPESALDLAGGVAGNLFGRSRGGTGSDLTQSPIDVITFRGTAGDGRVDLQEAVVRSTVFEANAKGTVTLAPVLTNSAIQIPVGIALSRPIAERLNMVPANTPANASYVALPDFLTETGTVGDPKARIDKKALASVLLQKLGGNIPGAGGTNAAGLLKDIGNIGNVLRGGRSGTNAPPQTTTNAPATNQNPVGNILDLLGPRRK